MSRFWPCNQGGDLTVSGAGVSEAVDAGALTEQLMTDRASLPLLDPPAPLNLVLAVVERLKLAADHHWSIEPQRSLELAGLIVAIGERRELPQTVALGNMARGDALKFIGRTAEAWEALTLAGQQFLAAGDEFGWARTRIGRLYLSTMLNCVPEALADAERARAIFEHQNDPERLLRLDWQTAFVFNALGEPRRALPLLLGALATAERLGPAGADYLGPLQANVGSAYEILGDLQRALEYYERARDLLAAEGPSLHLATVETNIGYLLQAYGQYRRALHLLTASLALASEHSPLEAAKIKWHILECYIGLNRHAEARDLAREVVADYRRLRDAFELGRTLLQLAVTEAELDDYDAARAALDEAETIFSGLGAAAWTATVWLRRGRLCLHRQDPAGARVEAARAAGFFQTSGQTGQSAAADLLAGQAALALGELRPALAQGGRALARARRNNVADLRYAAHLLLGQVAEARQADGRAARHYQAAAATTDRVQRGLTLTLRPGFLDDKGEALGRLIGLYLRQNQARAAFETLERAKAQVLLSYLTQRGRLRWNADEPHSRALIDELERLRAEHHWFYRVAHEPPTAGHAPGMDPRQALAEVAARERRMRAITEQLYLASDTGESAGALPSVLAGNVQQALAAGTCLIEYYDDGTRLWAFCLTAEALTVQPLPAAMPAVRQLLEHLQLNLSAALNSGAQARSLTGPAQRILQRLYAALIEPLSLAAAERIVIVPYGALHYLPFHLLYDGARYLVERQEVVVLPAAVLAARPGPRRAPGALVLAHAWGGRLPQTGAEARLVQALLGGVVLEEAAATRAALSATPCQVLHIAAHGHYRLDQPDLSYLELADGQIYTDDLVQQDLSYELVTLSACETGRARVTGGELIGLGRGFLYAGAGALLMSLWPVGDQTTLALMQGVYGALRAGQSKAAALRAAQRGQLAEDSALHPAFWGAFQLIGDARPLSL